MDLLWQSAVERSEEPAGSSTLCRLEQRADWPTALAMSKVLLELFIQSFKEAPSELILDFDATDDRVHFTATMAAAAVVGANPRFILTSLEGQEQNIYDQTYFARGEMEPTEGR
ncbi:MAG: transposase [Chthoniobacterales bacterium]